jgi:hypothetical protein
LEGRQREERIYCCFSNPGCQFLVGDPIDVSIYPHPDEKNWVLSVYRVDHERTPELCRRHTVTNCLVRIDLEDPGSYKLIVQPGTASPNAHGRSPKNSRYLEFSVFPDDAAARRAVCRNRIAEHKMAVAFNESSAMVRTLHDPWVLPPNYVDPQHCKWYPLHVFEGLASLYNETEEYYVDPFAYFLTCIARLSKRGFRFVTWHELLDAQVSDRSRAILLQFDLDAGARSMVRLAQELLAAGVTANLMIHRRARHWYVYDLEELDIEYFQSLEHAGWCFGYHHNALSNLIGFAYAGAPASEMVSRA